MKLSFPVSIRYVMERSGIAVAYNKIKSYAKVKIFLDRTIFTRESPKYAIQIFSGNHNKYYNNILRLETITIACVCFFVKIHDASMATRHFGVWVFSAMR